MLPLPNPFISFESHLKVILKPQHVADKCLPFNQTQKKTWDLTISWLNKEKHIVRLWRIKHQSMVTQILWGIAKPSCTASDTWQQALHLNTVSHFTRDELASINPSLEHRTISYKRKSRLGSKHSKENECKGGKSKAGNIPDVKYHVHESWTLKWILTLDNKFKF